MLFRSLLWTELRGVALVTGPSGVGKSITLRRFVLELDKARFRVIDFSYVPSTATGFLRTLNRPLGLPMRAHAADLFDQAQRHLIGLEQEQGPHPLLVIDDAEGLSEAVLDLIRRMTCYDLDAEDRFSILLSGTDDLLGTLRHPQLASLRSRVGWAAHTGRSGRDARDSTAVPRRRPDPSRPPPPPTWDTTASHVPPYCPAGPRPRIPTQLPGKSGEIRPGEIGGTGHRTPPGCRRRVPR